MLLTNAVIVVTGARGTGKSLFAATYAPPKSLNQVFYHDSERSANRTVQDLSAQGTAFGHYGDLQAQFKNLPSDDDLLHRIGRGNLPWMDNKEKSALSRYYEYILHDIDTNLTQDKYKVYVLDTLEKFESGMVAWCEEHKKEAGAIGGAFSSRGGQFWWGAYYPLYEAIFSGIFNRGVETIILCSHLKNAWHGNKPVPGKVDMSGKPLLAKLASFMVWLVNDRKNPNGEPAGLVLKERLGKLSIVGDSWQIRRMVPERIPVCTWAEIERYLEQGCDLTNPAPGETLSKAEKEMISELLTDEQMKLMILDAEKELEEARGVVEMDLPTTDTPVVFSVNPKVQEMVNKATEMGITAENRDEVRQALISTWPLPLQKLGQAEKVVDEALKGMGL